jgi:hypothetical protein
MLRRLKMAREKARRRRRNWALPVAVTAVLSGVLSSGVMVWRASEAAFTATTVNPASSWTAGTVTLTDDDSTTALFTATGLKPGSTGTKCIKVTYGGNITSGDVKLYAAAPTGTLGTYIDMTIEMGPVAGAGTFADCTGFTVSSTPVNAVALSTVGTKTNYSNGYSTGWSPTAGQARVFRFTYTLQSGTPDGQQGAACTIPFTWETQTT